MSAVFAYLAGLATIPALLALHSLWEAWRGHVAWSHYCSEYERLTAEYDELSDEEKAQFLSEKPRFDNHSDERGRWFAYYFQPKDTQ